MFPSITQEHPCRVPGENKIYPGVSGTPRPHRSFDKIGCSLTSSVKINNDQEGKVDQGENRYGHSKEKKENKMGTRRAVFEEEEAETVRTDSWPRPLANETIG